MDFESYSARHRPAVEKRLDALLPSPDKEPKRLHEAMRNATLDAGKRFRPLICIAACEAVGGKASDALDAACAIEMVHCFSLIHDDLPALDDDELRRGRPTAHIAFGEAIALLAGDALFCKAFEVLGAMPLSADIRLRSLQILAGASGTEGMVGGQTADIESEGTTADLDRVEWIHKRKTGALISAATAIGAVCGNGTASDINACSAVGSLAGHGFQIADDILNVTGDSESLGKPAGSDHTMGKATYPSIAGLDASRKKLEGVRDEVRALLTPFGNKGEALAAVCMYGLERQT